MRILYSIVQKGPNWQLTWGAFLESGTSSSLSNLSCSLCLSCLSCSLAFSRISCSFSNSSLDGWMTVVVDTWFAEEAAATTKDRLSWQVTDADWNCGLLGLYCLLKLCGEGEAECGDVTKLAEGEGLGGREEETDRLSGSSLPPSVLSSPRCR